MIDISKIEYTQLDRPEISSFLFHPRPEWFNSNNIDVNNEITIPVDNGVEIGARFHHADNGAANILFFHGNGEIVSDYDELGPIYNGQDLNFLPVDYRGYGRSTGQPSVTSMMRDAHIIFNYIQEWLLERSCTGPIIIMGRSLGSASALELAAEYRDEAGGLIIESGFANTNPLLSLLGVDPEAIGLSEKDGVGNIDKISLYKRPTLIIHAEYDHIIPIEEGRILYEASISEEKEFLEIPGANHNDILFRGLADYMRTVKAFADRVIKRAVAL